MRPHAIQETRIHFNENDNSRCKLGRSLYTVLKLTKDVTLITCKTCKSLVKKDALP